MNTHLELKNAQLFGLMADPSRLKIFKILTANKELCVTEISKQAGISLSAASHQLSKLELLGAVAKCRYGQEICYCWNKKNPLARKILKILKSI